MILEEVLGGCSGFSMVLGREVNGRQETASIREGHLCGNDVPERKRTDEVKCRRKDRKTHAAKQSVGMEKRGAKGMQAACFYTFREEGGWEYHHGGGKTGESRRQGEGMKAQRSDSGGWVRKAAPFCVTEQRSP